MRTRIKICGITSAHDAQSAARAGADAIGLVFYPPSPRHVDIERACAIAASAPPFIDRVALFVDPTATEVEAILRALPIEILQFHGDEEPRFCASFGKPYLKAARVGAELDLLEYLSPYQSAAAWLLDSYQPNKVGGTGAAFDWSLISPVSSSLARPMVLSGGLDAGNVVAGIRLLRPWAVDVSSGVERSKGVKDANKIAAFVAGVRHADQ